MTVAERSPYAQDVVLRDKAVRLFTYLKESVRFRWVATRDCSSYESVLESRGNQGVSRSPGELLRRTMMFGQRNGNNPSRDARRFPKSARTGLTLQKCPTPSATQS